ncbi:hypothetical protein COLO4_09451 [Corchorus olitorius]|uniref:F-box domain-containing protein n=1 Tax=Corchorus olitorius TaxID=93759 RepID=A0A1R3KC23_9ROSI|nr:hypothetical protein COLO4_09451 [Corchorus olitorius]
MSDYLPVEVIEEILKRLPVNSLLKCRPVCKTWNSLITDPSFIWTHLQTSLSKPHTPLLLRGDNKDEYFVHSDDDDFDVLKKFRFPSQRMLPPSPWFRLVGSCNGLICLCLEYGLLDFGEYKLYLWNPSIHKYITLPKPDITFLSDTSYYQHIGFGFDSETHDYKVLNLVTMVLDGLDGIGETVEAYLFSLNTNSWKNITATYSYPEYTIEGHSLSVFVNGILHWLGYKKGNDGWFTNMVLGLDTSTERFLDITLPENLVGLCPTNLCIMKYGESSIAVLKSDSEDYGQLEVWVMKEYGEFDSWTMVLHLTDETGEAIPRVLWFRNNGEVLLEADGGELASMDLECQLMEDLGIESEEGYSVVESYVESLVLLDKGADAGGVNYAN